MFGYLSVDTLSVPILVLVSSIYFEEGNLMMRKCKDFSVSSIYIAGKAQ